jgi:hypothetical protein
LLSVVSRIETKSWDRNLVKYLMIIKKQLLFDQLHWFHEQNKFIFRRSYIFFQHFFFNIRNFETEITPQKNMRLRGFFQNPNEHKKVIFKSKYIFLKLYRQSRQFPIRPRRFLGWFRPIPFPSVSGRAREESPSELIWGCNRFLKKLS